MLEVPGPPVEVELIEPSTPLRSDGRQLIEIRSEVLVDQFGNELLDGTVGVVQMIGPSGRGCLAGLHDRRPGSSSWWRAPRPPDPSRSN